MTRPDKVTRKGKHITGEVGKTVFGDLCPKRRNGKNIIELTNKNQQLTLNVLKRDEINLSVVYTKTRENRHSS